MGTICFTEEEQQIRSLIHQYFIKGSAQELDVTTWLLCQTNYNIEQLTKIMASCCKKIIPPNYTEYLKCDYWRKLSTLAKILANHHCQICGRAGEIHAHHKTYERLGMERLIDLIVVCRYCHKNIHKQ